MEDLVKKINSDKIELLKQKERLVAEVNYVNGQIDYIEKLLSDLNKVDKTT